MKKIGFTLFLATIVISFTSCEKENGNDVGSLLPTDTTLIENPEEVITFNLGISNESGDSYSIEILHDSARYYNINYEYGIQTYSDGSPMPNRNYWYTDNDISDRTVYDASIYLYLTEMLNFEVEKNTTGNTLYNLGGITSVGQVSGLSSITSIPATGWNQTLAATVGTGYIVKASGATKYYRFESYARIYVSQWIQNGSGDIVGAVIQYQPNWKKILTPIVQDPSSHRINVTFNQACWNLYISNLFLVEYDEAGYLRIKYSTLHYGQLGPDYEGEPPYIMGSIRAERGSVTYTDGTGLVYYEPGSNFDWQIVSSQQTITDIDLNAHTISGTVNQLMDDANGHYSNIPMTVEFDDVAWTVQ